MKDYSIFTTELDNFADPMMSNLFSVNFYDSTGYNYRFEMDESREFYPIRAQAPKQTNTLAKRWYFGTQRQDVINSDRSGETTLEFILHCDSGKNLRLFKFLGMPLGNLFLDEEQRYKHPEFNRRFDRIELVLHDKDYESGILYTLYNCNVHEIQPKDLDYSNSEMMTITVNVAYDTFDVQQYDPEA